MASDPPDALQRPERPPMTPPPSPDSPFGPMPELNTPSLLVSQLLSYVLMAVPVLGLRHGLRVESPAAIPWGAPSDVGWGLGAWLLLMLYLFMLDWIAPRLPVLRDSWRHLQERNIQVFGGISLAGVVAASLLAGVGEEILFRGWLQPIIGLWPTTVLFVVVHFLPNAVRWGRVSTWGVMAIYLVVSAVLGLLFEWRGGIIAPAVAHVLVDVVGLMLVRSRRRSSPYAARG